MEVESLLHVSPVLLQKVGSLLKKKEYSRIKIYWLFCSYGCDIDKGQTITYYSMLISSLQVRNAKSVLLNSVDVLLLLYISIVVLNVLFFHAESVTLHVFYKWSAYLLCYMGARCLSRKQTVLWLILLIGIIEAIGAICQRYCLTDGLRALYEITAAFSASAQLGGFMAVVVTLIFGCYRLQILRQPLLRKILLSLFPLFTIILICSDSRAAWLATIVGCGVIEGMLRRGFKMRTRMVMLVLGGGLLFGGYYYKQNSANGRLLIWRITVGMIADSPFVGHGINSFPRKYMYYQARFFRNHPNSKYAILADNIIYPYNEFLRITVELGIIGLLIVLLIAVVVVRRVYIQRCNMVYFGAFISLGVFSMFSYPSETLFLWGLFPLLLASMTYKNNNFSHLNVHRSILLYSCLFCLFVSLKGYYKRNVLQNYMEKLYERSDVDSQIYLRQHMTELANTPHLLDLYAQHCYYNLSPAESLPILQYASSVTPTSELFCDLGDLYVSCNRMKEAVSVYQQARDMIPHRILPKYRLFMLYHNAGDSLRAREAGKEVLSTEAKIENSSVLQMKAEVKKLLLLNLKNDID